MDEGGGRGTDSLTSLIVVFSEFERRCSSLEVWIDYQTDITRASRLLVDTASSVEGVDQDPGPFVVPTSFDDGRCLLVIKWWHDSELRAADRVRGAVVSAVKGALDQAAIEVSPPAAIFLSGWPPGATAE